MFATPRSMLAKRLTPRRAPTTPAVEADSTPATPPQATSFFDDRKWFLAQLEALRKLQSAFRRRRWRLALSSHLPIIDGPCGQRAFPIYRGKVQVGIEGASGRQYRQTSLCCLAPDGTLRTWLVFLVDSAWFERASLLAIVTNCVALAMQPPADPSAAPPAGATVPELSLTPEVQLELAFTALFTVELLLRVAAMGFAGHEHAYLSDAWNRLDCLVVFTSWLPLLVPSLDNVSAIRAARALRPLRAINRLPGLARQATTLIESLPHLLDVALLFSFIMVVYGVVGMQLFKGSLRRRCYAEGAEQPVDPLGTSAVGVCFASEGEARGSCGAGQRCLPYGENPLHGTVSFDDILSAWMTLFQASTLEGWATILYMTLPTGGALSVGYFVSLVILGAFYVPNLFLAVMWHIYSSTHPTEPNKPADPTSSKPLTSTSYQPSDATSSSSSQRAAAAPPSAAADRDAAREGGGRLRVCAQALVASPIFGWLSNSLILLNLALLMCEHHPMQERYAQRLETANLAVVGCFTAELALKIFALGLPAFAADPFNRFDAFVVLTSFVDVVVWWHAVLTSQPGVIDSQVLRSFRLLRAFRLLRSWSSLQRLLNALLSLATEFAYLMLLLGLILCIFALLGMQLFGGHYTPPAFDELPRTNFDGISSAMLTVFIIACGEGWDAVWVDTAVAVGRWSYPFFVALVVLANYMLLNLVVALLIGSFEAVEAAEVVERARTASPGASDAAAGGGGGVAASEAWEVGEAGEEEEKEGEDADSDDEYLEQFEGCAGGCGACMGCASDGCAGGCAAAVRSCLDAATRDERTLLIFAPAHPVRAAATALLRLRIDGTPLTFEGLMIGCIVLSSFTLGFESCDLEPGSAAAAALHHLDDLAISVFAVELLAKVVSLGLVLGPSTYLASGWNRLDGVVVSASLVSRLADGTHASPAIRALRILRVLRPLRLIGRVEGIRTAVQLLLKAAPRVLDVALVYLLFLDVFAILGVQLLAGRLGECAYEPRLSTRAACVGSGRAWVNPPFGHFDNVGAAALLLFEMATLEGWVDVLFRGVDVVGVDAAGVRDTSPAYALFFIGWVLVGSLCLLNLIVGVLVSTFHDIKRKEDEACYRGIIMTERQRAWVDVVQGLLAVHPRPRAKLPTSPWRAACFHVVTSPRFESAILVVILLNTALMAADGYAIPPSRVATLAALNGACTLIFVAEAAAKVAASGLPLYLKQPWNVFDFAVVLIAVADGLITLAASSLGANPTLLRVLRMVRITRVLRTMRVVRAARGLRMLLMMLVLSLPTLANIFGLFVIVTSMFALLGMQLFGRVAHGDFLDEHANFCSFPTALLTLFRVATGEGWNGLMHDAMVSADGATAAAELRCTVERGDCGSWLAVPFFVSYVILSTFIIIKMMIVLIIENFALALRRDQNALQPESAESFVEIWSTYDPDATGRVHVKHLVPMLRRLPPPLGLDPAGVPRAQHEPMHAHAV